MYMSGLGGAASRGEFSNPDVSNFATSFHH